MSHISVEQVCTMWATEDEIEEEERKNWGVCWLRLVWLTTQQVCILEMFFALCIFCVCVFTYVYVYMLTCMCRKYLYYKIFVLYYNICIIFIIIFVLYSNIYDTYT